MTGCRHNAKNTLVKNYLHLAEQAGAVVHPLTTVTRVRPRAGGGYEVTARWTKAKLSRRTATTTFTADQVVFSAAALGTQKLLHQLKGEGDLPRISDRLGVLTRTNSEAMLGALAPRRLRRLHRAAWRSRRRGTPTSVTHIEPCRYGRGSNAMALLQTVLADDTPGVSRTRTWLRELWKQRRTVLDLYDVKHWSERTVIALVMQTLDNSITTKGVKGRFGWRMTSEQGHGLPNPTYIPIAYEATRRMADVMGGTPGGNVGEVFNRPLTAHFIGGCTIGDSPDDRRRRPVAAALRPRGTPRRRRLRGVGEPRREPVADDHRPGRAGDGVLAQQGRGRPPSGARLRPTAGSPRWSRRTRSCPRPPRERCAFRSSASAERSGFTFAPPVTTPRRGRCPG